MKKMAWVSFDDGDVRGVFLKELVRESDYAKTFAGQSVPLKKIVGGKWNLE